jgi:hypothetical protein
MTSIKEQQRRRFAATIRAIATLAVKRSRKVTAKARPKICRRQAMQATIHEGGFPMRIIPDSIIWLTVMLIFSPSMLLMGWVCFNGWRHERKPQQTVTTTTEESK